MRRPSPHMSRARRFPATSHALCSRLHSGLPAGARGRAHNGSGAYEVDSSARADRLHGSPQAARLAVETEDRAALMDSLILCKFLRGVFTDLYAESADLLARVTGWNVTAQELQEAARRIVTAKKLY